MIRYALACEQGHEFESWFPSASSYDAQATRGLVTCPICGSHEVEKRLMAPSIGRKGASRVAAPAESGTSPDAKSTLPAAQAQPMAIMSERDAAMRAMLRAVREHVTKNADYVGTGFADEARKMHYGEIEHRSIYGEANAVDTKALLEEGVEIHPLPVVPDERN